MLIEVNYVAHFVLLVIHPTVRQVGFNLSPEVVADVLRKGDALILSQRGVGLWVALSVPIDATRVLVDEWPLDSYFSEPEKSVWKNL